MPTGELLKYSVQIFNQCWHNDMNNLPALSAYSNFSISHPHKSSFIVGTLSDNVDLHHLHNKGSIVSSDTHDFPADNLLKKIQSEAGYKEARIYKHSTICFQNEGML